MIDDPKIKRVPYYHLIIEAERPGNVPDEIREIRIMTVISEQVYMVRLMTYHAGSRNSQRAFIDLCPWRLDDFEWGGTNHISPLWQVVKE